MTTNGKVHIALNGVAKEYRSAFALRGVDLIVQEGQWVSVVGPSGSGKSTLLNIIGGLDLPSRGEVIIGSTRINDLKEDAMAIFRRENIGFIFQESHLVPYLDAVENVSLAQYFHSIADEREAAEALKRVGLGHRLRHRPSELSGGEQQRVCIARALINGPRLLLADEPTGNLDRENTKIVMELIRDLHAEERFTVILVTHDPFVAAWGERQVSMQDGRVTDDVMTRKEEGPSFECN